MLLPLLLAACGPQQAADGAASGSAKAASSEAQPPAVASARPPADDLDVGSLQTALGCPPQSTGDAPVKEGPCAVVAAVAGACAPWSGQAPSGEGRYIGRSFTRKDGKIEDGILLLRTRTISLVDAKGGLAAQIGITAPSKDSPAYVGLGKVANALSRHDVPPKGNVGLEWLKARDEFDEAPAMPTQAQRVVVLFSDHAFVCTGKGQQLFFVQPAGPGAKKGDGLYAELWPATW